MPHKIDRAWFRARMEDRGYTQNEFARLLGLDRGAWSRTLSGKRKMTDEERVKAASAFGVELQELLPRVGVPLHLPRGKASVVEVPAATGAGGGRVVGTVDAITGEVTLPPEALAAPVALLAIQHDPFYAGWVLTCRPGDVASAPDDEALACIVQLRDGQRLLRKVRPGFTPGRFDLGPVFGFGIQENDVEIAGVIPVEALRRV